MSLAVSETEHTEEARPEAVHFTSPNAFSRDLKVALTAAQFQTLAEVPPEIEWFANITNSRIRTAYELDVKALVRFVGMQSPAEVRAQP